MKRIERMRVLAAIFALLLLIGCGKQVNPVNMKEFTSQDGTYSLEADENYVEADNMGMENWLELKSPDKLGNSTLAVMQFPKKGGLLGGYSNLKEVIKFTEESNDLSVKMKIDAPANTVFNNVEAYIYQLTENNTEHEICVLYGETDYAHYMLMNVESKIKPHSDDYFASVCASFQENAEIIEAKMSSDTELPDTIRWFNASNAILIDANRWDYQIYGGLEPNEASQTTAKYLLDNSWGVTDKDSADETLEWLLSEGHRIDFIADMEVLESAGIGEIEADKRADFLLENFDLSEEGADYYARWYGRYEEYGEDAASGWDYNRALSQLANFYLAGYYTLEEALDASLLIAETVQANFDSWDDYMESYFIGYEYWSEGDSDARREIYEKLQNASDNPYSVDFNTRLEKSW
ncbi:MAG: DUF1266 domain-containing protein [Lachnospiraceae bacterium]|nr:DUF1266 domain-containing protein [Lachnospiraceae bacterium]